MSAELEDPFTGPSAGLLQRLPVALLIADAAGTIRLVSDAAATSLRRSRTELVGRTIADTLCPLEDFVAGLRGDEHSTCVALPDGAVLRIGFSISQVEDPQYRADRDDVYAIVFHRMTQLAAGAGEQRRLRRLAATGEASRAVLHEVKNSLAAITLGLEILLEETPRDDASEQTRALLAEARAAVLTVHSLAAIGGDLRTTTVGDLGPMLEDVRRVMATHADGFGVRLQWVAQELPLLPLDPAVMRGIVLNVVGDALRVCSIDAAVRVEVSLEGGAFRLDVTAAGPTAEAEAARQRAGDSPAPRERGTGLGLTLCNEVIEAANGTLAVTDHDRGRTTVLVRIPLPARRPRGGADGEQSQ